MFCAFREEIVVGAFRPGRGITAEPKSGSEDERSTALHERTHEYLTNNSTTGLAAIVCGTRVAIHDLTVLPDSSGIRPTLRSLFLEKFYGAVSWVHEGTATACEAIHWAEMTGKAESERLLVRPMTYADAAREILDTIGSFSELLSDFDAYLECYVRSSLAIALGLAALNVEVEPGFFHAANQDDITGFSRALSAIATRWKRILTIPRLDIAACVAPAISSFRSQVDYQVANADTILEEKYPGEDNARWRMYLASAACNPQSRPWLAVHLADLHSFRTEVASSIARQAQISWGTVDPNVLARLGVVVSAGPPKTGYWIGTRAEIYRPLSMTLAKQSSIAAVESFVIDLSKRSVIAIPELVGPFLQGVYLLLVHLFHLDATYEASLSCEILASQFEDANRSFKRVLASNSDVPGVADAVCHGVIVTYGDASLRPAVAGVPSIALPHFTLPSDTVQSETLIGTTGSYGLVRQSLHGGGTAWGVVRANYPGLPVITNQIDQCATWVLANGGNALAIWNHQSGVSSERKRV